MEPFLYMLLVAAVVLVLMWLVIPARPAKRNNQVPPFRSPPVPAPEAVTPMPTNRDTRIPASRRAPECAAGCSGNVWIAGPCRHECAKTPEFQARSTREAEEKRARFRQQISAPAPAPAPAPTQDDSASLLAAGMLLSSMNHSPAPASCTRDPEPAFASGGGGDYGGGGASSSWSPSSDSSSSYGSDSSSSSDSGGSSSSD